MAFVRCVTKLSVIWCSTVNGLVWTFFTSFKEQLIFTISKEPYLQVFLVRIYRFYLSFTRDKLHCWNHKTPASSRLNRFLTGVIIWANTDTYVSESKYHIVIKVIVLKTMSDPFFKKQTGDVAGELENIKFIVAPEESLVHIFGILWLKVPKSIVVQRSPVLLKPRGLS